MKYNYGVTINHITSLNNVEAAAKAGYDFIETPFSGLAEKSDEEIALFKKTLDENGLICASTNAFIPGSIKVCGPEMDDGKIKEYLARTFDRTALLGFKSVIFGSGGARNVPDGYDRDRAKEDIIHFLADIAAPKAAEYGITIGIEELRTAETNILNTCAEVMEYVHAVNLPNVKLLLDLYHIAQMGTDVNELLQYKGYVSHVHIASHSNNRIYPLPTDGDDKLYRDFYRVLGELDYSAKNISLEGGDGGDFEGTINKTLPYLKSLEN